MREFSSTRNRCLPSRGRNFWETREQKYDYIRNTVETQDELKDTIEKLCDNAIVPDSSGKFYNIDVDASVTSSIRETVISNDKKVLTMLGFNNHIEAWSKFYEWSIYGKIAYRMIYSFKEKEEILQEIIDLKQELGLVDINLSTKTKLTEAAKKKEKEKKSGLIGRVKLLESIEYTQKSNYDNEGKEKDVDEIVVTGIEDIVKLNIINLQEGYYNDDPSRKIYRYNNNYYDENEIVVVDFDNVAGNMMPHSVGENYYNRKISYADNLIRSFNILNRIEVSVVAWTVLNSMYRQKMVIPLITKVSSKAKEAISKVRNKYMDNFDVDHNGVVTMNGESSFNYMKNIVLAERNGRKPEIDTVQWNGYDMSNMKIPDYFRENFIRSAKIPNSRYNKDGRVGQLSMYKADGVPYDEIAFYNFLDRNLHQFSQLIKKPRRLKTLLGINGKVLAISWMQKKQKRTLRFYQT